MTAYSKPLLSTLKQSLADRHENGDLPTDSATLTLWTRLFNRGVEYCINKLGITKSTTLTTSSGTIALPTDFITIERVLDSSGNEQLQIPEDKSSGASGAIFWISGDFASGFYLNSPNDKAYTVYYQYHPVPMSSDVDVCPFPDEEAIVAYAYAALRQSESDPFEDSGRSFAECDARLREISSQYNINETPIKFTLQTNA